MSDIFTVVLDLSRVKNDNKSNQLYLAMADTVKMKNVYEFKQNIQFLFSLGCSVELFHKDVRLPDLEDIRVLSHLDVVQVRPETVEEKKDEGHNEKYYDGDPRPIPGDNAANLNCSDSKENVCNYKSPEPGKVIQVQEVSGYGDHGKPEMSCGSSFLAGNRASITVQKPKDKTVRNMCDMQENKTFRCGEKTDMAENLKVAAFLQNRYYGWCGKPDSNTFMGRCHFQKSNEMPDLKSGNSSYSVKNSGKFTDNYEMENKSYVPNEGDMNVSNASKGTMCSPVKLKEANNHELHHRKPHAHQIRSKSCSRSGPDPHSGPYGPHVFPSPVQKPLTSVAADYCEKISCAEGGVVRKPMTVEEVLKILTETAAERSKTLSSNNPTFHNDGRKNQFRGACKKYKANPAGGSQNFHKGNSKHQITSKTLATLDKGGAAMATSDGHNPKAVSCQCHVPKQDMKKYKVNRKTGSEDKSQGNALLTGCGSLCENQNQKTGNASKIEANTVAQKKKMWKAGNPTETFVKYQGKTSVKGCKKIDGNQGGKTESAVKVEATTGAPNPPLECQLTVKKKKLRKKNTATSENKKVSHSLISDCEHFDNSHGVAGETESETAPSNDLVKFGNVKNKMVPADDLSEFSNSECEFLAERMSSLVPNGIIKGKAFSGGESAGFEKSPSRELNSLTGDSVPGVQLHCTGPYNPTGIDTSSRNTSDFLLPGKDTRPNPRTNLKATDPVNAEDEDGANVSNSSANSSRDLYRSGESVAQDAAAYPFFGLQGITIARDDASSEDVNKDKSESHGAPITNKFITPNTITDNTSVQYTKDVNVIGDGGERGLASSQAQADLTRDHSRVGTEDAAALTGAGTGSAQVGGTDSASSGSRTIPTNEVIIPPLRIVERAKTSESEKLHGPEVFSRDTKVRQPPSSRSGSCGTSGNSGTRNNSRSGADKKDCVIC